MFKNTYQSGLLSIFYSCGSSPLALWDSEVRNGHIKRLTDPEVNSIVLEIVSVNVTTTFITCPKQNQVLGIRLPFLVMIVKNLKRYFSFEITILDDQNMRRRFRISNFQSTTKIKPFCTTMPIGLAGGWNQIQFNLADFTRRAYGSQYVEALRVQVHANVRVRRIYFADRLYTEEELPQEYKLYLPLDKKPQKKEKEAPKKMEEVKKAAAESKPAEEVPPPPAAAPPPPPVPEPAPQRVPSVTSKATDAGPEERGEAPEALEGSEPPDTAGTESAPEDVGESEAGEAPAETEAAPEEAPPEGAPAEPAPEAAAE